MCITSETWAVGRDETHSDDWTYYKTAKTQMPTDKKL